ncbi:efflux RND transporter periplasmic adaptor subunit [Pontiella sulfatireligans]|uniref:Efflux pump periplasmic linker BepF n=1 Tax=Pontiella sulfatireligans TaxID=2750658 RepID=A0A6C2UJ69_9BACT|nr:efflux RND transporter periplasmic adaptor subunit [Pontiella sulfatireligans]VGO20272.1 Efflux pump periplasmic linker BepF [Pontiella sulfatireligans]
MLKVIGKIVGAVALMGLGFLVSRFVPAGGPPPGMMGMGQMPPPIVAAMELKAVPLDVLDEYIGAVEPIQEVMVKSEVAGYIDQVHFTEGSFVKEGDLLFTIDQSQYQAIVEVREANLASAQAVRVHANKFVERMHKAGERSVSQSDVDAAESDLLKAEAMVKQAEANLNLAQIDLAYSEIRAPISGRIGMAMATKGNYVTSGSDALARIVQVDPIRVVFSLTDRAFLNLRQQEIDGAVNGMVAKVRLPNGTMLPLVGKKDFDDNEISSTTGTMAVRYVFENPNCMLVSGGYVTILLGTPERPMGLRIPQKAVLMDPKGTYVLTVDEAGLVGSARVQLGQSIESDFVVLSGLEAGDRVVVEGVQKAAPGITVQVALQEAL